ncbi:MAG: bifunctional lysine ketoglutarate reductase /saccharopine dehydrogenase family protein [Pseudomonadota bacterium]
MKRIGIRREDKSPFERRAALTPAHVRRAREELGLEVTVQPSPIRVFPEQEYVDAGAVVSEDLSTCDMILGVKEIPLDLLAPNQAYAFFSHTMKGQAYNMEMLRTLMGRGCTLLDYERIVDGQGRRLVFFGYYAGLAGMLDTLWALGQRAAVDGIDSPFSALKRAYLYHDLTEARAVMEEVGRAIRVRGIPYDLQPLVIGYAGYGNVSRGAQSIGDHLPTVAVTPEDLAAGNLGDTHPARTVYKVVFKEEHMARRADGGAFLLREYYDHPERYVGCFEEHLDRLSVLVNCIYWEERYPRLMTLEKTRAMWADGPPRLRVVGDISCDIGGSVEATVKSTTVDKPVFVWDVDEAIDRDGLEGRGPVIMAVDILPTELPRDSSRHFGDSLLPFLKQMAELDPAVPFEKAEIQPEIRSACLVWGGRITPDYKYMEDFI